jgi:hypothetical protein
MIEYFQHKQIDKEKWDTCIQRCINGLIYAQSWYLDIVAPGWDALIENDYESVMPLPAKHKYRIPYLIQPHYTQQLGIFSINPVSLAIVKSFLQRIPSKFIWRDFNLNSQNPANFGENSMRQNFELNLRAGYNEIYKGYNENTQRNLKKALQTSITLKAAKDTTTFLDLFHIHSRLKLNAEAIGQLRSILEYSINHNYGEINITYNAHNKEIAGAFFLKDFERIIYLGSFNTDEGQQNSAMFLIMDTIIKKYVQQPLILDFEGSMIPGIARFFAGFGAQKVYYPRYRYSLIPFI